MSKSMPTSRGLLHGWQYIRHIRAMHVKGKYYMSPWIYEPMRLNPPPQGPFVANRPPKIVLPMDKLKRTIERYSIHGRSLSEGLAHDYSRRPIDRAAARVQALMRENENMTEKEAVKIFDREYERELIMRQRECDLLKEDAIKSGEGLTVLDSLQVLQMIRDLQKESMIIFKKKIEIALHRATLRREEIKKTLSERSQHILDQITTQVNERDLASIDIENVEFPNRLFPLEKIRLNRYNVEKVVTPSIIRQINQALRIQEQVIQIRDFREKYYEMPNAAYSQGEYMSPFDLLIVYMNAYDINIPEENENSIEKLDLLYGREEGKAFMDKLSESFKILFDGFKDLSILEVDTLPILKKLDVKISDKQEKVDMLEQVGLSKVNFDPILCEFEELLSEEDFETMKADQKYIENLFYVLQVNVAMREFSAVSKGVIQDAESDAQGEENIFDFGDIYDSFNIGGDSQASGDNL